MRAGVSKDSEPEKAPQGPCSLTCLCEEEHLPKNQAIIDGSTIPRLILISGESRTKLLSGSLGKFDPQSYAKS